MSFFYDPVVRFSTETAALPFGGSHISLRISSMLHPPTVGFFAGFQSASLQAEIVINNGGDVTCEPIGVPGSVDFGKVFREHINAGPGPLYFSFAGLSLRERPQAIRALHTLVSTANDPKTMDRFLLEWQAFEDQQPTPKVP